ncbi:MAG: hypothetical protein AUH85_00095 [Chloroflexi bacterium 13_1_40CM_4_68_4]|nr:MAG: hypothetical protein AUH85_00095 [Chloroflexi bacterium 13_1_40CM_4_68_4]
MNPLARVIAIAFLVACEAPAATPTSPPPSRTTAPTPAPPTASPTPPPYRFSLLYGDFLGAKEPTPVSVLSLNGGLPHVVATIAPEHDGRFAIHPESTSVAILDKLDHHLEHTTTWRVRLVDLSSGHERDVIRERTDTELVVPWDLAWSVDGRLLLASRPSLDVVDLTTGARTSILRFPDGTIGVTFRDPVHPAIVVSQTLETFSIYVVDAGGVRHVADRPIVGATEYAFRPGSDEILELVTRYQGRVTLALLRTDSVREWTLDGPKVEGYVPLIGTTPSSAFLLWPVSKSDPAALDVEGSAYLYSLSYDASLTAVAGVRNWGEFGPLGVSPDGRALIVPTGEKAQSDARFSMAICCERHPPVPLLGFGDRFVIGWIAER